MLLRLFSFVLLVIMGRLEAQPTSVAPDSTQQEAPCTTIKIKKPAAILEVKMELSLHQPDTLQEEKAPSQDLVPVRLPHIYDGSYGLLPVLIYDEKMDLKQGRYIVFDYLVNAKGEVSNVRIYNENDAKLKQILLKELEQTRWFPAINKMEEPIDYRTKKQVLYLSKRTLDEDYDLH